MPTESGNGLVFLVAMVFLASESGLVGWFVEGFDFSG